MTNATLKTKPKVFAFQMWLQCFSAKVLGIVHLPPFCLNNGTVFLIPSSLVSVNSSLNSHLLLKSFAEISKSRFLNSMKKHQLIPDSWNQPDLHARMDVPFEDAQPSHLCQVTEQEQKKIHLFFFTGRRCCISVAEVELAEEEETLCNYSCNHPSPAGYRLARVTLARWKKKSCRMPVEDSTTGNPFVEAYRVSPRRCIFHASFVGASICGCQMTAGGLFVW